MKPSTKYVTGKSASSCWNGLFAFHTCSLMWSGSVYCGTKHFIAGFTDCARHDLVGTAVRVTAISPGAVNTEFSTVRFKVRDASSGCDVEFGTVGGSLWGCVCALSSQTAHICLHAWLDISVLCYMNSEHLFCRPGCAL